MNCIVSFAFDLIDLIEGKTELLGSYYCCYLSQAAKDAAFAFTSSGEIMCSFLTSIETSVRHKKRSEFCGGKFKLV